MDLEPDVFSERQEAVPELVEHAEGVIDVRPFVARDRELDVGVRDTALDELAQPLRISQVEHANAASTVLVLVRRPDSPPRRADLLARRALFVDQLVVGENEVRAVT